MDVIVALTRMLVTMDEDNQLGERIIEEQNRMIEQLNASVTVWDRRLQQSTEAVEIHQLRVEQAAKLIKLQKEVNENMKTMIELLTTAKNHDGFEYEQMRAMFKESMKNGSQAKPE
ncbi:unnamed protein product [Caenorhabditis brenneri]